MELFVDVPYERRWCLGSIPEDLYTHCLSPSGSEGLSLATVGKKMHRDKKKINLKEVQSKITKQEIANRSESDMEEYAETRLPKNQSSELHWNTNNLTEGQKVPV